MFAGRQAIRSATRFGVRPIGMRYASTKSIGQKVTGFVDCAGYWTKVVGEVSKQVYAKEGLAPPKLAEFTKLYNQFTAETNAFLKNPKAVVDGAVTIGKKSTSGDWIKYACYFVQIVGFFSIGEIIGRRQIVGYPDFGPKTALKKKEAADAASAAAVVATPAAQPKA